MAQNAVTDMTMLAKLTFDDVVSEIQGSGLNYTMQLTPYSAMISLRNSFVTDRNGLSVLPPTVHQKSVKLKDSEKDIDELKDKYRESLKSLEQAEEKIRSLEKTIIDSKEALATMKTDLEIARNDHEAEVNTWKKDLLEINKKHHYLEKKLEEITTDKESSDFTTKQATSKVTDSPIGPESPTNVGSLKEFSTICSGQIQSLKQGCLDTEKVNSVCVDRKIEPVTSCCLKQEIPSSLATHRYIPPPRLKASLCSISSLRSHYVMQHHPPEINMRVKEEEADHKTLFEKYEREFQETCKQS